MAHRYTRRIFTACIVIGAIAAILSLGALTGPTGWAALSVAIAGSLHTTPMVLGITGAGIMGVGAALRVGSLFACRAQSTDKDNSKLFTLPRTVAIV